MYFAMDEIGSDNVEMLQKEQDAHSKWLVIDRIASAYGFGGIQLTPSLYEEKLGLSLRDIPHWLNKYRLTLHVGGMHKLDNSQDIEALHTLLEQSLNQAAGAGMEDVSLHPPVMTEHSDRTAVRQSFAKLLKTWIPTFRGKGVSLSVENHAHEKYWVFLGPDDFADFAADVEGLGVLIDISHSINDGYSEEYIRTKLGTLSVTGLHLSDALANTNLELGTHLSVGKGEVDFKAFLAAFANRPHVYGALEIKGPSCELAGSLTKLRHYISITA